MTNLIYIAGGGAVGSVLRHWMITGIHNWLGKDFPYGTLSVNLLGSFAIGLLYILLHERLEWRLALIVGLLGSFTTFSAFSLDTLHLIQGGQPGKAALNIFLSISLCLAGCWLGIIIGKKF